MIKFEFDLNELNYKTFISRSRVNRILALADNLKKDPDKTKRLNGLHCLICWYQSGKIVGQAFTSWSCKSCGQTGMHPNTGVPQLCNNCAEKMQACIECGGDLNLKKRKKLIKNG